MIYSPELRRGGLVLTNSNSGLEQEVFGDDTGIRAIKAVLERIVSDEPRLPL